MFPTVIIVCARNAAVVLVLLGTAGCRSSWQDARVQNKRTGQGYVQCEKITPASDQKWKIGSMELVRKNRRLRANGPVQQVALFQGPAPFHHSFAKALNKLSAKKPDLAIMLGSLGDQLDAAKTTVELLAKQPYPVLVLPGGRDDMAVYAKAMQTVDADDLPVIDLSSLTELLVGSLSLQLLPGTGHPRYARTDQTCAHHSSIPHPSSRPNKDRQTWLVSWSFDAKKSNRGLDKLFAWPEPNPHSAQEQTGWIPRLGGWSADDSLRSTRAPAILWIIRTETTSPPAWQTQLAEL